MTARNNTMYKICFMPQRYYFFFIPPNFFALFFREREIFCFFSLFLYHIRVKSLGFMPVVAERGRDTPVSTTRPDPTMAWYAQAYQRASEASEASIYLLMLCLCHLCMMVCGCIPASERSERSIDISANAVPVPPLHDGMRLHTSERAKRAKQ